LLLAQVAGEGEIKMLGAFYAEARSSSRHSSSRSSTPQGDAPSLGTPSGGAGLSQWRRLPVRRLALI